MEGLGKAELVRKLFLEQKPDGRDGAPIFFFLGFQGFDLAGDLAKVVGGGLQDLACVRFQGGVQAKKGVDNGVFGVLANVVGDLSNELLIFVFALDSSFFSGEGLFSGDAFSFDFLDGYVEG